MWACPHCKGLLIATPFWTVACTLCGTQFPLSILAYSVEEWAALPVEAVA